MLNRAEVTGGVLIGPKPTGLAFRPDEVTLLSSAARGIGQNLHALKVERLEALAERLAIEKPALAGRGTSYGRPAKAPRISGAKSGAPTGDEVPHQ